MALGNPTLLAEDGEWAASTISVSFTAPSSGDVILVMAWCATDTLSSTLTGYTLLESVTVGNPYARLFAKSSDGTETSVSLSKQTNQVANMAVVSVPGGDIAKVDSDSGRSASDSGATLAALNTSTGDAGDPSKVVGGVYWYGGTNWYSSAFGTELHRDSGGSWSNGWVGYEDGPSPAGTTGTNSVSFSTGYDHSWFHVAVGEAASTTTVTGTASGAGGGSGTATGLRIRSGTASGSGGGTGTATGTVSGTVTGTASGAGGGSGTATGVRVVLGTATGSGGGTGAATGVIPAFVSGTAIGSGGGTGAATGQVLRWVFRPPTCPHPIPPH